MIFRFWILKNSDDIYLVQLLPSGNWRILLIIQKKETRQTGFSSSSSYWRIRYPIEEIDDRKPSCWESGKEKYLRRWEVLFAAEKYLSKKFNLPFRRLKRWKQKAIPNRNWPFPLPVKRKRILTRLKESNNESR